MAGKAGKCPTRFSICQRSLSRGTNIIRGAILDNMLCFVCRKIAFHSRDYFIDGPLPPHSSFRTTSKGPFFYPHHSSFEVLQHHALEGCNFCVQITVSAWPVSVRCLEKEQESQVWLHYRLIDTSSLPRAISISCAGYHASIDLLTRGETPQVF